MIKSRDTFQFFCIKKYFWKIIFRGGFMKDNINALDEINKGATMGMDAIDDILDKVKSNSFKKMIEKQYQEYDKISKHINEIYNNYNEYKEPHEINIVNKIMTNMSIEMKTLTDKSDSKIAELLLQGTNMGIIEGRKILNNKKLDNEVKDILKDYVTMQEKCVENLKEYL